MITSSSIQALKSYLLEIMNYYTLQIDVLSGFTNEFFCGEISKTVGILTVKQITTNDDITNELYAISNKTRLVTVTFNLEVYASLDYNGEDELLVEIYNLLMFDNTYDFKSISIKGKTFDTNTNRFLTNMEITSNILLENEAE